MWARVKLHPDCHVQFEKAYYSASFRLVRQRLWLRATETTVHLFRDLELVATHLRQFRAGSRCTIDEHLPPEAIAYKLRDPQWCLRQSEDIGAACHALIERLFAHRVLDNLRAAQSVIGLARRFGTQRLDAACQRALTFDDPKYRTVKTILENGIDLDPSDEPAFDRLTDVDGDPKAPKSGEHKIWGLTFWIAVFWQSGSLTAGSLLPAMKASCVRGLRRVTRRAEAQRRSRRAA